MNYLGYYFIKSSSIFLELILENNHEFMKFLPNWWNDGYEKPRNGYLWNYYVIPKYQISKSLYKLNHLALELKYIDNWCISIQIIPI